jgi:hypothetical protein
MDAVRVGIRYQPLGDYTANEEVGIYRKHWVLVFSGTEYAFTIEAGADPGKQKDLVMGMNPCPVSYPAFHLGIFYGKWSDLRRILKVHPQRGSPYSPFFNNCQHFVAIYLLFLEAFCSKFEGRGRRFIIRRDNRYAGIRETLNMSGRHVWNKPNTVMAILNMAAGATTIGAVFNFNAAEYIEDTISAADGVMGWLGVRNSLIDSAPYIDFPTFSLPIVVGCTGLAAGAILLNVFDWSQKTLFHNPKIVGCRRGHSPSLIIKDYPIDLDTMAKLISSNSNTAESATLAGTVIAQNYFSNRGNSERADVFYLFELAGKLIK